ncbi:MAG: ABC transporter permease [Paracoccaceae bacterium]|nr:ABC transporter permease [Paracoccaceae bacterium]
MGQTATSLNLIWVLTWLKFLPRTRRESAKLFWLFVEPAGQLSILIILFTFIGRTPAYGTSMALFLLTGIVMLNFFQVGSSMVMAAMLQSSNKLRLAPIGIYHDAIASSVFKLITAIGYTALLLIGVWYIQGIDVVPKHPLIAAQAFLWCTACCMGMGLLRAYATKFLPLVERVYATLSRGMIFISGVFFVPSFMPPQIRELLVYNPVLHVIELFRLGMYDQYPSIVYSSNYLQLFALGSIALGAGLIWRQRSEFME